MYEVFEQQLQNNGLSARQVSLDTGIGTATFSDWKAGRLHPRNDKIKKLADYFGVTVEYLKTGQQKKTALMDGLSETDKTILSLLDQLSPQEREKALAVLKAIVDKQ